MHELIIEAIERGGYIGIALLMAIENIFPPIPSEVIMGIGGVLVARGSMEFVPLLIAGTIGSTAGNYAWFWVGDKWGYRRLRPIIDRWGRWLTLDWEHIEKGTSFFRSHGHWVVMGLRVSPFLRTMISLPAGLSHMGHGKFLAFTFVGAGVWNALLVLAGSWLAKYLERSQEVFSWVIVGAVGLALVAYGYRVLTWEPRPRDEEE